MTGGTEGITLLPAREKDRGSIEEVLRETGLFREPEIGVGLEVLDVYLTQEGQEDYQVHTARRNGSLAGYVCFGRNAVTEGTFELYWIAVRPSSQGTGVGTCLLEKAESEAREQGGRLMAVETSSRSDYEGTRVFYSRRGYRPAARVPDYYAPGDDKVIFLKSLSSPSRGEETRPGG